MEYEIIKYELNLSEGIYNEIWNELSTKLIIYLNEQLNNLFGFILF